MIISLAMIVRNEERFIKRCLESVGDLVDEIVIVDTGSTDNTINIIKSITNIKVYNLNWNDDFSIARNYALEQCKGDYILVLDADEYIIEGKREELEKIMANNKIGQVKILSHFERENQIYYSTAYISRFFPKEIRYIGSIHEQLDCTLPKIKMNINIGHDGYYRTNKSNRNIPLLKKEVEKNPNDPYYLFQFGKELRLSNKYEEAYKYLKMSYKIIDNSYSYYGELVVELIITGKECKNEETIEIIHNNEEVLIDLSDFHFNKGLFYLEYCLSNPEKAQDLILEIEKSFLRCINLNGGNHTEYLRGTSNSLAAYNLGVYYEVTGNLQLAKKYYEISYQFGYLLAENRLNNLS